MTTMPEGDGPHRDHRREIRQRRQAERPEARVLLDQQGSVLGEVTREEDDEDDLEQLGRLTAHRPEPQGQPLPRDIRPEDERQQQQGDPGRRPGVLVATKPRVRAHDDRRAGRATAIAEDEPDQLDLAQAQRRSPRSSVTSSWGSRCMRSSEMPPSSPTTGSRTWSVPPSGQHLGDVRQRQRAEVDAEARGVVRGEHARPARGAATRCRRAARSRPGPGAAPPSSAAVDGSGRGCAGSATAGARPLGAPVTRSRARSSRRRTWPIDTSSPKPSGETPATGPPVHERAVRASEVLDVPAPAPKRQHGVLRRTRTDRR